MGIWFFLIYAASVGVLPHDDLCHRDLKHRVSPGPVFKAMKPFAVKVAGYNPLSSSHEDRKVDIVDELRSFDFVLLAGTGCRELEGGIPPRSFDGATMYSAGFSKQQFSNKSCGVSIVVGPRFKNLKVHAVIKTPPEIGGRGIALRVSARWADFTLVSLYFPPVPWSSHKLPAYRKTCRLIVDWYLEVLNCTPGTSTPLTYADVNDGLGLRKVRQSWEKCEQVTCIVDEAFNRERIAGGAGELMREALEEHGLFSLSTALDQRHTFFGNDSSSLIDHIFGPSALQASLLSAGPLYDLSKRLQLIRRRGLADHVIIHSNFLYVLSHGRPQDGVCSPQQALLVDVDIGDVQWDPDLLLRGLREGHMREEFIRDLEAAIKAKEDQLAPLLLHKTADAYMQALDSIVISVGLKYYSRKVKPTSEELEKAKRIRMTLLRLRRSVRAGRINATVEMEDALERELLEATANCRRARRKVQLVRDKALLEELYECWGKRRMAEVNKILKSLCGGYGPKVRSCSSLTSALPSCDDWLCTWSLPGREGGMLATLVDDWSALVDEHLACASDLPPRSMNYGDLAKRDVKRLKGHLVKCTKRKSCPKHSVPAALLLPALIPAWRLKEPQCTAALGLGHEKRDVLRAPAVYTAYLRGYYHINQCGYVPLKWELSWGASIPKPGSKQQRVIHRLCEQGKAFFSMKMKAKEEAEPTRICNMAQGFRWKRRREAGVVCQLSSVWRARRARRSGFLANLDMKNAFASSEWCELEVTNTEIFLEEDLHFAEQRHSWACVELPSSSPAPVILRPRQGALMGDQYAVKGFLHTYERPIGLWNCTEPSRRNPDDAIWFDTWSPICPLDATASCDLSLSLFADDVVKFIMAEIGADLEHLLKTAVVSLDAFDEYLGRFGYAQNRSKLVAVTALSGEGSRRMTNEIAAKHDLPFRCARSALSLGVTVCHDLSAQPEIGARLSAIRRAYHKRGKLWTKEGVPTKLRRMFLISDVQNASLSGMESLILSKRQLEVLDAAVARIGRIAMRGAAVQWDAEGKVVGNLSTSGVLRFWRIGSSDCELGIRRLKWLQAMSADVSEHHLILCAMFGHCHGEQASGIPPTIVNDTIDELVGTPWAIQAAADIRRLGLLEAGREVLEAMQGRQMNLFKPSEARTLFLAVDVTELRALELSAVFAPWDYTDVTDHLRDEFGEENISCALCSCVFATPKQLLLHMRTKHGIEKLSFKCVVTNQCPICLVSFSTQVAASRHFQKTLEKGFCSVDRTFNLASPKSPGDLSCPFPSCEHEAENILALQLHIASSHFSWCTAAPPPRRCHHAAGNTSVHGPRKEGQQGQKQGTDGDWDGGGDRRASRRRRTSSKVSQDAAKAAGSKLSFRKTSSSGLGGVQRRCRRRRLSKVSGQRKAAQLCGGGSRSNRSSCNPVGRAAAGDEGRSEGEQGIPREDHSGSDRQPSRGRGLRGGQGGECREEKTSWEEPGVGPCQDLRSCNTRSGLDSPGCCGPGPETDHGKVLGRDLHSLRGGHFEGGDSDLQGDQTEGEQQNHGGWQILGGIREGNHSYASCSFDRLRLSGSTAPICSGPGLGSDGRNSSQVKEGEGPGRHFDRAEEQFDVVSVASSEAVAVSSASWNSISSGFFSVLSAYEDFVIETDFSGDDLNQFEYNTLPLYPPDCLPSSIGNARSSAAVNPLDCPDADSDIHDDYNDDEPNEPFSEPPDESEPNQTGNDIPADYLANVTCLSDRVRLQLIHRNIPGPPGLDRHHSTVPTILSTGASTFFPNFGRPALRNKNSDAEAAILGSPLRSFPSTSASSSSSWVMGRRRNHEVVALEVSYPADPTSSLSSSCALHPSVSSRPPVLGFSGSSSSSSPSTLPPKLVASASRGDGQNCTESAKGSSARKSDLHLPDRGSFPGAGGSALASDQTASSSSGTSHGFSPGIGKHIINGQATIDTGAHARDLYGNRCSGGSGSRLSSGSGDGSSVGSDGPTVIGKSQLSFRGTKASTFDNEVRTSIYARLHGITKEQIDRAKAKQFGSHPSIHGLGDSDVLYCSEAQSEQSIENKDQF